MLTRRQALYRTAQAGAAAALATFPDAAHAAPDGGVLVNDIHSQLNKTQVSGILRPKSLDDLQAAVRQARRRDKPISVAGSRHAMGGQQFRTEGLLLDMRGFNQVLRFDRNRGLVEVEAGIEWPELFGWLAHKQQGLPAQWGIRQKQTGADRLSLGGALAANIHGRGLAMKPIIDDVESFTLIDASGELRTCSRRENPELFSLAVGGYGLFGIIAHVTLRLAPRTKIQRVVELRHADDLLQAFESRIADGFLYGDFQYATDPASDDFLHCGVFSCYRPVDPATSILPAQKQLTAADWQKLVRLAHVDRTTAFEFYSRHYLATSGQLYWSDAHQLSTYLPDYHRNLDGELGHRGSEMITEVYVPRDDLPAFLSDVRGSARREPIDLIYGTVRLIEQDDESFLAWARQPWACTIFNLHVEHSPEGLQTAARRFRRLIDHALRYGGSYYLTYHRWATPQQVEACHPRFLDFLRLKQKHDPDQRFQSDWYRHHRALFADRL